VQQTDAGQGGRGAALLLNDDEDIAIWALRRVAGAEPGCRLSCTPRPAQIEKELAGIADRFRSVFVEAGGLRPLRLALPGSRELTKDERRLLHAIAAAQAEDLELLDNYLYKLALDRTVRAPLAEAVKSLAACLGVHGSWLPLPSGAMAVPAAALAVARVQGHDLCDIRVTWP
jgi:hypothetical protein